MILRTDGWKGGQMIWTGQVALAFWDGKIGERMEVFPESGWGIVWLLIGCSGSSDGVTVVRQTAHPHECQNACREKGLIVT